MNKHLRIIPLMVVLLFLLFHSVASAELVGGATVRYAPKITSNVTTISVNPIGYYYFIPTSSQTYSFYSGNSSADFWCFLDDSEGNALTGNDDSGSSDDFYFSYDLIAGSKYYLQIGAWGATSPETCDLAIIGPISSENPITVSDEYINIDGASGFGNTFITGDTVSVTWAIGHDADDNPDVNLVLVDFSQFGGTFLSAEKVHTSWVASYTITNGSIDDINRNVSIYAENTSGFSRTGWDGTNATVDNEPPVVTAGNISISGASGAGGVFIAGDSITATWNNTASGDNNDDISHVTVDFSEFGGGSSVSASSSADIWSASFTIADSSSVATNLNVSITATDDAGNTKTTEDTSNATIGYQSPDVSDSNISISGSSGNTGIFIIGDTVTATWDNTSSGDNNDDIVSVSFDFTEFGGASSVSASDNADIWTAEYIVEEDTVNDTNCNVSLTATNGNGLTTTAYDSSDATVDSYSPTVVLSNNDRDNVLKVGDTVIISATFNEPMTSSPLITIKNSTVLSEPMINSGDSTTWTYKWTVSSTDTAYVVTISGSDIAGNLYTGNDKIMFKSDNTPPVITGVSNNGIYVRSLNISFNEGVAFLNGKSFSSGSSINEIGEYSLKVTDAVGNMSSANFSIRYEKAIATSNIIRYQLIDIERQSDGEITKVILNVNTDVLTSILNSRFKNKDINIKVLENSIDKSVRSFYLRTSLPDIALMREHGSILTIETSLGKLIFNPMIIDLERLSESFHDINPEEIVFELSIAPSHSFWSYSIRRLADINGYKLLTTPVTFDMRCSYDYKTVVLGNFADSLEIWIPINDTDVLTELSAVRLMPDMTLKAAEVEILSNYGKYHAKFRSFMNGTFAIIETQ